MHHNLNAEDIQKITEAIEFRRQRFQEESFDMSVGVVLMNYGARFVEVVCLNREWSGVKGDLTPRDGVPLCPNGHPLFETSTAPVMALVWEDSVIKKPDERVNHAG